MWRDGFFNMSAIAMWKSIVLCVLSMRSLTSQEWFFSPFSLKSLSYPWKSLWLNSILCFLHSSGNDLIAVCVNQWILILKFVVWTCVAWVYINSKCTYYKVTYKPPCEWRIPRKWTKTVLTVCRYLYFQYVSLHHGLNFIS